MASVCSAVNVRCPLAIRASVSSGSRAPANIRVGVTPTQLRSRLDALRQKTKSLDRPHSASVVPSSDNSSSEEILFTTHFSVQRARLQHWWREHLEDKAALVHAAAPDFSTVEEEATVVFGLPVEVDWVRDRYPSRPAFSRF